MRGGWAYAAKRLLGQPAQPDARETIFLNGSAWWRGEQRRNLGTGTTWDPS